MEAIGAILLALGAFVAGILGNLIATEVYESTPTLSRWLLKRAAQRLPTRQRARYVEEWNAHLEECPGALARLAHAVGCLASARKLAFELQVELVSLRRSKEAKEIATRIFRFALRETYKKIRIEKGLSIDAKFYEEWEHKNLPRCVEIFLSSLGDDSEKAKHAVLQRMNELIASFGEDRASDEG